MFGMTIQGPMEAKLFFSSECTDSQQQQDVCRGGMKAWALEC